MFNDLLSIIIIIIINQSKMMIKTSFTEPTYVPINKLWWNYFLALNFFLKSENKVLVFTV